MIQKTYLKTKEQCKVKFTTRVEGADKVEIYGLNNDWENPLPLNKRKDGSFCSEVSLPKNSTHEFKYLVNGTDWRNEPESDGETPNNFGGTNSLLVV